MKKIIRMIYKKMKRLLIALALVIPVIFLMFLSYNLINKKINTFNDPGTGIIVLDSGHGGVDGGTSSNGLLEKEINLSIAKRLKKLLVDSGFTVIMTREEDVSLDSLSEGGGGRHQKDLNARVQIINSSHAQLFISIHVNSNFNNKDANGSIVFYNPRYEQTKELAYSVQRVLNAAKTGESDRTVHDPQTADYYILNYSQIPGIIAEVAFISNRQECEALATDEFRDNMAKSIALGIKKYYVKQRGGQGTVLRPRRSRGTFPLLQLCFCSALPLLHLWLKQDRKCC
jgi:N-acetylmuramoyl-L-alanine amidase